MPNKTIQYVSVETEDYSRIREEPRIMKETYKIKSRTLGSMYASFSMHAHERMKERKMNLLTILCSLTEGAEALHSVRNDGDVLLLNARDNISMVLSVSTFNDILYFNIITVLADIPKTEDGELKFHHINHIITI